LAYEQEERRQAEAEQAEHLRAIEF
jgi:hypothetical protein